MATTAAAPAAEQNNTTVPDSPGTAARKKHVIAVDVDEVLASFVERLAEFHNEEYGSELAVHHFHSYEFRHVWGGTDEEASHKVNQFFLSKHFEDLPRVRHAFDVLQELKDTGKYEFVVVTARQNTLQEITRNWIERHYPGIFSALHFGNHYGEGHKKSKAEMCIEAGAKMLIDDSLRYAKDVSSAGIKVLLFDLDHSYGWNKTDEELHEKITRVHCWTKVKEHILDLASSDDELFEESAPAEAPEQVLSM